MIAVLIKHAAKKGLAPCLMFQDEARFGRMNNPARCWAPHGMRPLAGKQLVREYTYAFAAIAPMEGKVDSLILPAMNRGCLSYFLREVSQRHPDRMILMVMDGAASHRQRALKIPDNILIAYLPPYSPELNPVEHLWNAPIASSTFPCHNSHFTDSSLGFNSSDKAIFSIFMLK